MYNVNPEHTIGLLAGLLALPIALMVLRFHPGWRTAPGTVQAAAVLMTISGAVHLALIGHHLTNEPVTAALFLLDGVGFLVLATTFTWRWWRLASASLLVMTITGYVFYIAVGFEGSDQVGLASKLVEVTALGLVLVPVRGEQRPSHRTWRWTSIGVGVPVLMLMTGSIIWIADLARPDPRHSHAGALLQATNAIPTRAQQQAAAALYAATAAAIAPYKNWHNAWAAGFRPGATNSMSSTHWMNQANVDAGYVMDPNRPQGLVYANTKHGPVLIGAMFQMKHIGQFGPDPGGPITAWHQHENICVGFGFEFSLMTPFDTCPVGSVDLSVSPMLHVWIVDNPKGGPFAVDIDPNVVKTLDRT